MLKRSLWILATAMLLTALFASAARAQSYDSPEDCMAGQTLDNMYSCRRVGGGPWERVAEGPSSVGPSSGAFGGFILFALLWGLAPAVICGMIASSRGIGVGLPVVLGLFLGWIGLIIVAVAFKAEVQRATQNIIKNASNSDWPRPSPSAAPPRRDAASRLADLQNLKDQSLITEEEYGRRREAILSEI